MNKILTAARRLTDKPTFMTNMAVLFSLYAVISAGYSVHAHPDTASVLATLVCSVLAALTCLAAHDDYKDFIAHSINRKQQRKANV